MRTFQPVATSNGDLGRAQQQLRLTLDPITAVPLLDGVLVEDVALTTSTKSVKHGLGRAPTGWLLVRKTANANVWDAQDSNAHPELTLDLVASGSVTVSLWVF